MIEISTDSSRGVFDLNSVKMLEITKTVPGRTIDIVLSKTKVQDNSIDIF